MSRERETTRPWADSELVIVEGGADAWLLLPAVGDGGRPYVRLPGGRCVSTDALRQMGLKITPPRRARLGV